VLRLLAAGCAAGLVVTVAASRVPNQLRLPVSAVVPGAVVTQPFGCTALELEPFDPFCPTHHVHTGIDLAATVGTPVFAASAGVARVGYDPAGAGLFVVVAAEDGTRVLYCHLSAVAVATGQAVTPGARIGDVGATGLATGPHLHFEVQVAGRFVDPTRWLEGEAA
jgi:murein DD-endopeptidase MepM/ murein hydrolase activator NlpD